VSQFWGWRARSPPRAGGVTMAGVELLGVGKRYDDGYEAVHAVDLNVAEGELVVLVGPSGCGKTTTLRMVAGLESVTRGEVRIGGRRMNEVPPKDRDVGMVFQSYALYPHMTVRENMAFGLELRKLPRAEIDARVREAAALLGLGELLDRKPKAMSGGQRQRVAMGRAIVRRPRVFLFDEPLSNLDAKLRGQMRVEIARLHRRLGATSLYVTHDQVEAMTLADRIVLMSKGKVQQIGAPLDLYERPANLFVATFLGTPTMNTLRLSVEGGHLRGESVALPATGVPTGEWTIGARAEDAALVEAAAGHLRGQVEVVERLGPTAHVHVRSASGVFVVAAPPETRAQAGDLVGVTLNRWHRFDPKTEERVG